MAEKMQEYLKDSRRTCKYGLECYQKNSEHHKQFKHPPPSKAKIGKKGTDHRFDPYRKTKNVKHETAALIEQGKAKASFENDEAEELENKIIAQNLEEDSDKNIQAHNMGGSSQSTNSKNIQAHDMEVSSLSTDNIAANLTKCLIKSDSISYYDKDVDKSIIKECFLLEMPEDFFYFYECLSKSESAEKLLSSVNLQLIGPYDLLLGKLPKLEDEDKELYLVHWRFFYDVPEFQAVIKKKGKSEFHIGYYRDDPKDKPVFLAKNDSAVDCTITPIAENIFGAVYWYLQNEKKTSPFTAMACQKLMDKVKKWADEKSYSLEEINMKKRNQQIACRTFHQAGIVVPYNKKTQLGYRKLAESDKNLKKMFQRLEEAKTQNEKNKVLSDLQPMLTFASIAMDECDFGTGLEAGIALFCSGLKDLQTSALNNLEVAYSLLNREAFEKIIKVHMQYRRKGPDLSILSGLK